MAKNKNYNDKKTPPPKSSSITRNDIKRLLPSREQTFNDKIEIKITYFFDNCQKGYKEYKKINELKPLTEKEYATEILKIHGDRIEGQTLQIQETYFQQNNYIEKIIKDFNKAIENRKEGHINIPPAESAILKQYNDVLNIYDKIVNIDLAHKQSKPFVLDTLLKRIFNIYLSASALIIKNHYTNALILWRSAYETSLIFKIIEQNNEKIANKFLEKKVKTKTKLGVVYNLEENKNNKIPWYIEEKYGWFADLVNKDQRKNIQIKTLAEYVKLDNNEHVLYQLSSLFVHENLITIEDFPDIELSELVLYMYWNLFDKILKNEIHKFYKINDEVKKEITGLERNFRESSRKIKTKYNDFLVKIS
jgi:hypothetical protein